VAVFDFEQIKKEIRCSPPTSSVYIGADSKVYRKNNQERVAYVTVIILHYGSSNGAKIFKSHKTEKYHGGIRERLMSEVAAAIDAGLHISDVIDDRSFEIHLDINRDVRYKSSEIIKEATGYVLGTLGFEPKLKPDAFAASSVADRFCVNKTRHDFKQSYRSKKSKV